ncbi:hypothetical protein KP509_22G070100 [Ceratopteris richardii]|uniref:Uncharacterized protein n=1 Tax=Ceratopteris richardii TaxID=49495 RepID=A0A8T2S8W0_CERRI|nr:hypothetical protein KP509_22G070100 [Ceratopteris richardii]
MSMRTTSMLLSVFLMFAFDRCISIHHHVSQNYSIRLILTSAMD